MSRLLIALALLALAGGAVAAPPEEAIMPLDKYTTQKGRTLATTYARHLHQIYDRVYHCRPWLEVQKASLGFSRPAGATGDDRFLNIWVWVDQKPTPEFAALSPTGRASAMFSRHGVDLLRQLSAESEIFASPMLTGYSVVLTWLKPRKDGAPDERAETVGVFVDKATVRGFLARRIAAEEFVRRATIVAFDGKDPLGRLPLQVWEDNFATTFKLQGYEPGDKNTRC